MTQDILIDDTGDLIIENGDFKLGPSDEQHVILIVNTMPGSWKRYPICGVGIIQYSASSGQVGDLKRNINVQLEKDGYTNITIDLQSNNIDTFDYFINADRPE
jgi:hypothetical protein